MTTSLPAELSGLFYSAELNRFTNEEEIWLRG